MKTLCLTATLATACYASFACADDTLDAAIGGGIGGAAGAAIGEELGGRDGAILGGAMGAAAGTAVSTDRDEHDRVVIHREEARQRREDKRGFCPPGHAKKGWC